MAFQGKGEWTHVINAQVNADRVREEEERRIKGMSKQLIRDTLDTQMQYKNQMRINARQQEIRQENELVRKQLDAIQNWDMQRRMREHEYKEYYAQAYEQQLAEKRRQQQEEINRQRVQEVQEIERNNQALQIEQQNRDRLKLLQQQNLKGELDNLVKAREQEKQNQRNQDLQWNDSSLQDHLVHQRQLQYQQYYQELADDIKNRTKPYEMVQDAKQKKQLQWLETEKRWQDEVERRQREKELSEREFRRRNQQSTVNYLQQQLEQKKKQQNDQREASYIESLQIRDQVERAKQIENELNSLKAQQRYNYANELKNQMELQRMQRGSDVQMDQKEKILNKSLLERIQNTNEVEFRSIPGINQSQSPLVKIFPKEQNALQHFKNTSGTPQYPSRNKDINYSSPFSQSLIKFDPNKHDPIINPIGAYVPKPVNGSQFGKGRGLALLNAGSNVLNN